MSGIRFLSAGGFFHPLAVEGQGFDFGFVALGRNLFAIDEKAYAGGVAYSDGNFASGTDGCAGRRDQSFVDDGLTVGSDRDP